MKRRSLLSASCGAAALTAFPYHLAFGQAFPSRPIRIIVPFTPGSATDTMARPIAERLSAALGQPVTVENRAGAGGTIGMNVVAKAPPDRYTLGVISTGHVVNPVLYANIPYDTLKDFAAVAPLASLPSALVVSPSLGFKSVRELVAAAKAKPGTFNYATAGIGSGAHISAEKFRMATGIDALHVPFKGSPESLTETMGGRTQFTWTPLDSRRSDQGRALAGAGGQHAEARGRVPRRADDCRSRLPQRRVQFLGRSAGACSYAVRGGRPPQ